MTRLPAWLTRPAGRGAVLVSAVLLAATVTATGASASGGGRGSAHEAPGIGSSVTMVSDSGEYVGGGKSRVWRTPRDAISTSGAGGLLEVEVSGAPGQFTLDFAAPSGETLQPGAYPDAQRDLQIPGRPGIDVNGDSRGCNQQSGRFWVLDITPDRSRVWIVYEQHCEGGEPALFGEIRIGEPTGAPELTPSSVQWPTAYPGVAVRPVPVHVVNRGSHPLEVTRASIAAGRSDFSVLDNACGRVKPGGECTIYVGFTPSIRGPRLGELAVTTSAGTRWVPLSGYGRSGRTYWEMHSAAGDFIGAGQDYAYTPDTGARISAGGSDTSAQASVAAGADSWTAEFEAAPGSALLPGTTFADATRYPFNAGAGLDISGNGRGCNNLTGSFTVESSSFTVDGTLASFLIDFEQHCEIPSAPALTGTIAWRAPDVSAPSRDRTAPHRARRLAATIGAGGRLHLTWRNPSDRDWVDTQVTMLPGKLAPTALDPGRLIYTGRGDAVSVTPGSAHSYTVAAVTRDKAGNTRRAILTVRIPG